MLLRIILSETLPFVLVMGAPRSLFFVLNFYYNGHGQSKDSSLSFFTKMANLGLSIHPPLTCGRHLIQTSTDVPSFLSSALTLNAVLQETLTLLGTEC